MKPIKKFQIGKKGLTQEFVEQLKKAFGDSSTESIKISLLKSSTRDKKQAQNIGQELVDGLGKNFTFKLIGYTLGVHKWRKDKR
jgi:RNA-binding protein YhbY